MESHRPYQPSIAFTRFDRLRRRHALAHPLIAMHTRLQHESHVERLIYFACDTDDIICCFINYQYTVTTVYAARVIIYIMYIRYVLAKSTCRAVSYNYNMETI